MSCPCGLVLVNKIVALEPPAVYCTEEVTHLPAMGGLCTNNCLPSTETVIVATIGWVGLEADVNESR